MPAIQNADAINAIREAARLSISEGFPTVLNPTVQAIIDMTPRKNRIATIVRAGSNNNSDTTLYTTPTDKDFYLTFASLHWAKDVTATSVFVTLKVTVGGVEQNLLMLGHFTVTAMNLTVTEGRFDPPIKLDRGTPITVDQNTTTANTKAGGSIVGYTVEA